MNHDKETGFGDLPTDEDELAAAYPWPPPRAGHSVTVRGNMIGSLDGGATVRKRSAGLSAPSDVALFALMRDTADVILAGAGTVRAERYSGIELVGDRAARRQRWGFAGPPPIAVVTGGGLAADLPLFAATSARPIVITSAKAAATVPATADAIVTGDDAIDLPAALAELAARGLTRVQCEGGPSLLGELVDADLLDELCLTISPRLLGVGTSRPLLGGRDLVQTDRPEGVRWTLASAYTADELLFTRYRPVPTR